MNNVRLTDRTPPGSWKRLLLACAALTLALSSSGQISTPVQELGHKIGEDYFLANYQQLTSYWKKLATQSKRIRVETIGKTEEFRDQLMAIVTAPENMAKLDKYREISLRLANAKNLTDDDAAKLAKEGKAVVWIDGGLHATEVLCPQMLIESVYRMVSGTDEETERILRDVIILFVHANPDGMDLVSNWYMSPPDPLQRNLGIPRLYQKYIGHDNNRDFYAATQQETQNMCRIMFREWAPQIVHNHHQTGPRGTVLFVPPFRDPFNHNVDPLVMTSTDAVGLMVQQRLLQEGKPGATTRTGANYSAWWNGGLRTVAYFHNIIGILTETIGSPTPMRVPFVPERQVPSSVLPAPVAPQEWKFAQSVEYSHSANLAILDYASRYREQLLINKYRMGRNSIQRGSEDTWTRYPKSVRRAGSGGTAWDTFRSPATRDARVYVLPSDQPDFPTATKFVRSLQHNAIEVEEAAREFEAEGKRFPAGSYVIRTAQAYRPHILDMFEPQDHPDDIPAPGAPPTPPYDSAGWTLAMQMGVRFERLLEDVRGSFRPVPFPAPIREGKLSGAENPAAYAIDHRVNNAAALTNLILRTGKKVRWLIEGRNAGTSNLASGTILLQASEISPSELEKLSGPLGVHAVGLEQHPAARTMEIRRPRIGLMDVYGGSMPSGWIRWLLEQFLFAFEVIYPKTIDAGQLRSKYDAIILPSGMSLVARARETSNVPMEFQHMSGSLSAERSLPALKEFVEAGGTLIAIGSSTSIAQRLGVPVRSALVETGPNGVEAPLPPAKFYVPGSILRMRVDTTQPIAFGLQAEVDVMFDNSPAFKVDGNSGVTQIGWFDTDQPLRSGWAWGQSYLKGSVGAFHAKIGQGSIYGFGPEITFRAQPHGTFQLLFNALFLSAAKSS